MDNIKVSILCLVYNHAKYIRSCLDGFVMQKTNFKFEVLIHDDASTDGTTDIIREYEEKYPDIIKPVYQTENQFSKGVRIGKLYIYPRINGQYVSMCEGDDYWTDPYKLQKQVDFLDANPDYSVCFHPVKVIHEGYDIDDYIFPEKNKKNNFTFNELLKYNFIQTNSVMYRWKFKNHPTCDFIPENIIPGDWYLTLLHAKEGKIKILPDVMAVYRRNPNGIWSGGIENNKALFVKYGVKMINLYFNIYKNICDSSEDYLNNICIPNTNSIMNVLYDSKKFKDLEIIYNSYPELVDRIFDYNNLEKIKEQKKFKKYKFLFNIFLVISIIEFILLISLFI